MEPIKIMVLGMSGAGKTVYLASLYVWGVAWNTR